MRRSSTLEAEAALLIRAAGLPNPERECLFAADIGRRWRFDFAWPDHLIALELDGDLWHGRHTRGGGRQADMVRDAYAISHGWRVFRCDRELLRKGYALRWVKARLDRSPFVNASDFPRERVVDPARYERNRRKAALKRAEKRSRTGTGGAP